MEEVELLYQKKSRMRIRPRTAVNAKITKSSVFTDRSSTITRTMFKVMKVKLSS